MFSQDQLNTDAIDEMALALLFLTLHDFNRAWKGFDRDVLNRLHEAGWIQDPRDQSKSIIFTGEGLERAEQLFRQHFVKPQT